jgi:hypothetical protein
MKKSIQSNTLAPVLAYPFQITDLRTVRRKSVTRKPGRKRPFPGIKVRMMGLYVQELRACAEAIGWRFDAFLYQALMEAKWKTERLFGMSHGGLVILSKADRARLASHYQAVCDSGRKAQLSDFYDPRPDPVPGAGEPLAWAVRSDPPTDSN